MAPVSFIHCADTHLGKIQQNLIQRFEDFLDSFKDVVDYAVREKADFIIVSGDFFDKRNINPDTFSKTYGILEKLKQHNIPLIACEGNHDKTFYGNRLSWMETLAEIGYIILLKPGYDESGKIKYTAWNKENKKGFYCDINNEIRIVGLGYLGPEANDRLEEIAPFLSESKNNNKFNILLLHGIIKNYESDFIGNISANAVNNLKNCCEYIALGHQHKKYEHENFAFNPGSLEYWDIQEVKHKPDEKGFYHVKIDENGKINYLFKTSCKRPAVYLPVDISGTRTPDDVDSLVISGLTKEIRDINNIVKPIIHIALKGTITYDVTEIDTNSLKEKIAEQFKPVLVDIDTEKIRFAERSGRIISPGSSREEIEKQVIMDCIEQSGFDGSGDKMTPLILDVITLASAQASGEKDEEIYKIIIGSGIEKKKVELKVEDEKVDETGVEKEIKIEEKSGSGQKSILDFE